MSSFVHLHVHSEYSMLDGLCKLEPLVRAAKADGQVALGLTDHGGMYGALHFYNACKRQGIKPIIGLEAYLAKNSRFDKQSRPGSDQFHLTILAKNFTGYQNLMRLTSIAHLEGFSYKPRIDHEILFQHAEGLVITTGCMSSLFNRYLRDSRFDEARELLKLYQTHFPNSVYVEIQSHPAIEEMNALTKLQVAMARECNVPLIATNDVHYVHQHEAKAQDALLCVQTRKLISDTKRMSMMDSQDFHLRTQGEMFEVFHEYPDAIENTIKLAELVDISIPTGQLVFPNYDLPEGETAASHLRALSEAGVIRRYGTLSAASKTRIDYELSVIQDKGYDTYFLITQDFVNWAKQQGIGVGPGRGSAAGSLVSYALGITDIDPIKHGLAFERFLNPQRPTPPDIDLDFADDRRDEVISYVSDKYGENQVGHVITFGRMEARVAIRDIGRVLGLPYEDPDKIAKLIPNDPGKKTSLKSAIETVPELKEYYKQPKFKELIDLAMLVEGSIRHSSVHAAALIITDKPLSDYTPIQRDPKSGKMITQYDMYALDCNVSDDAIGLLKFDFLGLRNLSTIQTAVQLISRYKQVEIDISNLPLDDSKTYALLSRGDTMGVFQLESAGMRRVARTLRPSQFSDITAMVALFRPGPMELIPTFVTGKHKPESVEYPHETLKPILEETYGIMVYQEQILEIANVMAGYSLGEADILRRAIGKKKKKLLDENKKRFTEQSIAKGYEREVAEKVWGFIEAFANYGFNKAHAASYAMIAYQTAFLKANYPVEYMSALMSVESASHSQNRDEKIAQAIEECKQMGIIILPPDINASESNFTIEQHPDSLEKLAIRWGLNAIKHVGSAALDNILATREQVGTFSSFTQFLAETDGRKVNKTTIECLIKVGAMDHFSTRASMLENLEHIRQTAAQLQSQLEGQDSLFANIETSAETLQDTFATIPEYPLPELLSFEKALLGLYLTQHPLARQLKAVSQRATKLVSELDSTIHLQQTFLFGGVITQFREVVTKKSGATMGFGRIEDTSGSIAFVIFPKTYERFRQHCAPDTVVLLKGKLDNKDDELQLIVDAISVPDETLTEHEASSLHREIFIPRHTSKEKLQELGALLKKHPGTETVVVLIPNGSAPDRMVLPYGVAWSEKLEQAIAQLLET